MLERLDADIKAAMLSGDKEKARALNYIKSALLLASKDQGVRLNDEQVITLLRKEVKKRQEAAEFFDKGENAASAEKERYEIGLIEAYLPAQLSDEQISEKLKEIVSEQAIPLEQRSMGQLISAAKQALGPAADPAAIARIAGKLIRGELK